MYGKHITYYIACILIYIYLVNCIVLLSHACIFFNTVLTVPVVLTIMAVFLFDLPITFTYHVHMYVPTTKQE